jgi:hypothetical protein
MFVPRILREEPLVGPENDLAQSGYVSRTLLAPRRLRYSRDIGNAGTAALLGTAGGFYLWGRNHQKRAYPARLACLDIRPLRDCMGGNRRLMELVGLAAHPLDTA